MIKGNQFWLFIWLLLLALLSSCGRTYTDPAILAVSLEPETVFAELSNTTTLPKAATQFATALNIDPAGVRVRLKPGDCSLCSLEARPKVASLAGLSVAEAEQALESGDEVSFFIPKFSCTFVYDGETLTPKQCQPSPV